MHFEILVEDQSGKKMLEILVRKIIGHGHTFRVMPYKGVGHIPKNMRDTKNAKNKNILNNLPKLLKGYGRLSLPDYAIFVVCDLDDKCLKIFRGQLLGILNQCNPKPNAYFCIAVEEGDAWFLGDQAAIKKAYPRAKALVLQSYKNDSICGTWQCLADAVHAGGAAALSAQGYQAIGKAKSDWASTITPHMVPERNVSPSFRYFRDKLLACVTTKV